MQSIIKILLSVGILIASWILCGYFIKKITTNNCKILECFNWTELIELLDTNDLIFDDHNINFTDSTLLICNVTLLETGNTLLADDSKYYQIYSETYTICDLGMLTAGHLILIAPAGGILSIIIVTVAFDLLCLIYIMGLLKKYNWFKTVCRKIKRTSHDAKNCIINKKRSEDKIKLKDIDSNYTDTLVDSEGSDILEAKHENISQ